ncbi:MAG: hypothetical protein V8R80_08210 [Eubacterium sp.]
MTEEEKRTFYEENGDLFTRYFGDSFSYEEVRMIIEKRLKEMEMRDLCRVKYVSSMDGKKRGHGRPAVSHPACGKPPGTAAGRSGAFKEGFRFYRAVSAYHLPGSADAPIRISAYGEGEMPLIEAEGQGIWYQDYGTELDAPTHTWRGYVSSAVLLYDADYITVSNLAITNHGAVFVKRTVRLTR